MRSIAALLLLATATHGLSVNQNRNNVSSKLYQLSNNLSRAQQTNNGQQCDTIIKRFKSSNIDYNSIIGSGKQFTDTEFSFANDAVYWPQYNQNYAKELWYDKYEVFRAREKLPTATLWGNQSMPGPNDIEQGYIGDCYLMAGCAAIAENGDRVKKIFVTQTYNKEGIIVVKPTILGNNKEVVVDDYLAFFKKTTGLKGLTFDHVSERDGLWGPFLEKAFAKAHGNFDQIKSGSGREVFTFMFGIPSTKISNGKEGWINPEQIFDTITKADQAQYIMWSGVPGGGNDQVQQKYGLAMSHAYTVIGTYVVNYANGTEAAKLLRIRNPWGSDGKYNGTWCDKSEKWTDEVNKFYSQVPFVKDQEDGVYFVDLQTYHESFDQIIIGFWDDSYSSSTSTIYGDAGFGSKFEFTLSELTDGFLGLDFYSPRMYPPGCRDTSSSALMKVYMDGILVNSQTIRDSDYYGFIRNKWLPGTYTVVVSQNKWGVNDVRDFSFRAFLPVKVNIQSYNYKSQQEFAEFTNKLDFKSVQSQALTPINDPSGVTIKKSWSSLNNYFYSAQGVVGKQCTISLKMKILDADAYLITEQPTSSFSKSNYQTTVVATGLQRNDTEFTVACTTTGNQQCNWMMVPIPPLGNIQASIGPATFKCI
eukprot:403337314